ncbi:hypothetical protein [Actinomadura algeriensis]|uniref:Uncharacterized protein n=1 Tax=Actinomadura algeriensis TaxID=1679523 RepID=A0ABR9K259_9ACTN|nr:hypothetical protein [Actinomadura algeriensis]MBE1536918.1 hypothetical protein [Actinomadura algeriensis]
MVGKPPNAWFIGIMLVPAIGWLGARWFVEDGSDTRFFLGLGTILAVLAILVRVTIALWPRMVGTPPSVWFTGAVTAVGGCAAASEWFMAVEMTVKLIVLLAAFIAVIAVIGRTALAFSQPRRDAKAFEVRACAPAIMTVAVLFVPAAFPPGEVRMELSRTALKEYASTVEHGENCGEPRWVGLYRVTCATRDGGLVSLEVDEPLIPTDGRPWLVGPDFRDIWIQD